MFSIQEVEKSLPAAPKMPSQSKENGRARAQTHWRRKHDAKSKGN